MKAEVRVDIEWREMLWCTYLSGELLLVWEPYLINP